MNMFTQSILACVIALAATSYAVDSPVPLEVRPNQDRVGQLFAILGETLPAITDPNADRSKDHEIYMAHRNRITSATQELARMGDPAVDRIIDELRRATDVSYVSGCEALRLIGSEKSQNALLDMALGRNGFEPDSNAARIYVEMMEERKDKAACKVLLTSTDRDVLFEALRGIWGVELDADSFEKVRKCLKYQGGTMASILRERSIGVIAADPSSNLVEEKVQALVESLATVKDVPEGQYKKPNFEGEGIGNLADNLYHVHVSALAGMKGVDSALRSRIAAAPEGIGRNCLMIALAKRGDMAGTRESLKAFLKDPEYRTMSMLKRDCLDCFLRHGEERDVAFLTELSTSDPYQVEEFNHFPGSYEKWGDEYMNLTKDQEEEPEIRFAPKVTMLVWGEKTKPRKTTHPIRMAAQSAIKAIGAREKKDGQAE